MLAALRSVRLKSLPPRLPTLRSHRRLLSTSRLSSTSTNGAPRISNSHRDISAGPQVARSNHLITQLARRGRMAEAHQLFDETPHQDVISWTALISGYARCGMLSEARHLFNRPDAQKNVVTWTALLSGYARSKLIKDAEVLFEEMPEKNVITWNTMMSAYADSGFVDDACRIFKQMPVRNLVSWNTMLSTLAQSGRVDEAYKLFGLMPERDVVSWTAMVAGFAQNESVDEARHVFDQMPEKNVVSWNAMISGYLQNRRLGEALKLFGAMPARDIPSWNTMITGFIHNGELKRAQELFDRMTNRNVVSWTTIITGYVQHGQNEMALKVFSEMLIEGIRPNQGTYVSTLDATSNLAALGVLQQVHQMVNKTLFQCDLFVESALMNAYAKCGEIRSARNVFDLSKQKDLVSWNGMITAYGHHGNGREAICLYEEMLRSGFRPNDVTYVGLLSACGHSGLVDEGLKIFHSMLTDGTIEVQDELYACLIDLCGRAGRLEEAKRLIARLKVKPSSAFVWGAHLGGCNKHGSESIGKLAAKKLLHTEPDNPGTYIQLSNIYALEGKWTEAARIRSQMINRGLKKQPGCSWIQVGAGFHVFVVNDKSHGQSELIYSLLHDLYHKMRNIGYFPSDDMLNE